MQRLIEGTWRRADESAVKRLPLPLYWVSGILLFAFMAWSIGLIISANQRVQETDYNVQRIAELGVLENALRGLGGTLNDASAFQGVKQQVYTATDHIRARVDQDLPTSSVLLASLSRIDLQVRSLSVRHATILASQHDPTQRQRLQEVFFSEMTRILGEVSLAGHYLQDRQVSLLANLRAKWWKLNVLVLFCCVLALTALVLLRRQQRALATKEKAEQLLQDQLHFLQLLVDTLPNPIFFVDRGGLYQLCNKAFGDLWGHSKEHILGTSVDQLGPPGMPAHLAAYEAWPTADEGIRVYETPIRCGDGSLREVLLTQALVTDTSGQAVGLLGLMLDITERKEAEESMRQSEQRFRELFESSPDAIFVEDFRGNVLDANPMAGQLHGIESTQLIGQNVHALVPPDKHEQALDDFDKLIAGELDRVEGFSWTIAGRRVPVEIRARRITYDQRPALLLHVRDVTERKQFERDLIHAKERAEEANRLQAAFLANMSHEVRTPLTAIVGFAAVLAEEIPAEQHEFVELIRKSGDRLMATLNSVLDLAQLESCTLQLSPMVLDVAREVEETVRLFRKRAEDKGLQLTFEGGLDRPLHAFVDRAALDRILSNLLSNAIKFTPSGRVTVSVSRKSQQVVIRVEDTGAGIDEAFLPHLFEKFKQESNGHCRGYEGVGLGLTITKQVVELMGGEIAVESTKGLGTVFTVCFRMNLTQAAKPWGVAGLDL